VDRRRVQIPRNAYPQEAGMRVVKWGNSLALRLPAAVVEALALKAGDEIEIHVADARLFGVARKPARKELLKRLRTFRGRLPTDFKFDRDDVNAR
jgi:antitoxin MazE